MQNNISSQAEEFAAEFELGRVPMTDEAWNRYRMAIRLMDASNKRDAEVMRYEEAVFAHNAAN